MSSPAPAAGFGVPQLILTAFVLFSTLVTFSSPFSSAIHFLSADNTHFGAYGWCYVNQGVQADACEAWFGYE